MVKKMIIRNSTIKTLKASTLSNRGCVVPLDRDNKGNIDPEGAAHYTVRALFQSAILYSVCYPRVLATLVPPVTERGRFQRPVDSKHADNHIR